MTTLKSRRRPLPFAAALLLVTIVGGCNPPLTIEPGQLPEATVGQPYEVTFTFSSPEPIHGAHVAGALPDGLRFRYDTQTPTTATLVGTPTVAGTTTFKVIAFGPQYMFSGADGEREYTLVVR